MSNGKKGWTYWGFWIAFPIYIAYTIFAMIIQVGMVPKIFEWIENAPINENLPKEKPADEVVADDEPASDFSSSAFDF